jgi:hypothetical protein
VYVLVISQWLLVISFSGKLQTANSKLPTQNNGYDLSLSFSLIAQSKAPLENYMAKVYFIWNFGYGFRILLNSICTDVIPGF